MLVRAYDPLSADKPKFSQNLRGIVDEVISFSYTRRAYDIGSFEMTIPESEEAKQIIVPGVIIIAGDVLKYSRIVDTSQKTIANNAFYVTSVTDTDDETIHITGYDLKYLLSFRVTLFPQEEQDKGTYGYYVTKGTTFQCVSDLIDYNLALASDEKRRIFGFGRIVMPSDQIEAGLTGIADDRYMTRLEPLSTAVFNLLKNCKTHFWEVRVMIDEQSDQPDGYIPRMESGEDKTPLIITPDLYNISAYDKTEDISAYKNVLYAVSNDGSSTKALVRAVSKDSASDSGITRKEVVVDVDAETVEDIPAYALKSGEEYEAADDFEVTPIFNDDDAIELVQPVVVKLGIHIYESVITEITDEYSGYEHTCSFVVGNKKIKVLNVLNKAIASTNQKTINNKIAMSGATNIDTAIVVQEQKMQEVVHNYTEIGYIAGNSVGYGGVGNSFILGGYLAHSDNVYEPDKWYSEISFPKAKRWNTSYWGDLEENVAFYCRVVSISANATNFVVGHSINGVEAGHTSNFTSVGSFGLGLRFYNITAPDDEFEYGSADVYIGGYYETNSGYNSRYDYMFRLPFQSEAEYNAAIGLTNTPLELIKIQDFQYLMPESQIIVDKALSPDSDNVIANSAVAKAMELKADKTELEKLSERHKRDVYEINGALSDIDSKNTEQDERLKIHELNIEAFSLAVKNHTKNTANPHSVTKEQIGLGNVENKSSAEILSGISIGGTQILRNTQTTVLGSTSVPALWSEGAWRKASGTNGTWVSLDITDCPEPYIRKGWKITSNASTITISQNNIPLVVGKEYTLSCYVRGKGRLVMNAQAASGGGYTTSQFDIDSAEWVKYFHTYTAQVSAEQSVYIGVVNQGDNLDICGMKMEIGNRATAWNVCPMDTASLEERVAALEAAMLSLGGET